MKNPPVHFWIRIAIFVCGALLVYVLFVPMWRIDLDAPQYPEGLKLFIYPHKLGGNVDIVNGLNHYIGMKTLHTEDFFEFKILPYIIGAFAALFGLTALLGNRKLVYAAFLLFVVFGVVAMADFYRWEYNYGHDLNPDAAIIVPGMSYQPPLIGFKQLLNFGAYSIPETGGWIFLGVGMIMMGCVFYEFRTRMKKQKKRQTKKVFVLLAALSFALSSCSVNPDPIKIGIDNCGFCKMVISDAKFGAEFITKKGKILKFDEPNCLLLYLKDSGIPMEEIKQIYLTDFCDQHVLIKKEAAYLMKSESLNSPMGGNVAAFSSRDSMQYYTGLLSGSETHWNELLN